jgi:hypothetical protein
VTVVPPRRYVVDTARAYIRSFHVQRRTFGFLGPLPVYPISTTRRHEWVNLGGGWGHPAALREPPLAGRNRRGAEVPAGVNRPETIRTYQDSDGGSRRLGPSRNESEVRVHARHRREAGYRSLLLCKRLWLVGPTRRSLRQVAALRHLRPGAAGAVLPLLAPNDGDRAGRVASARRQRGTPRGAQGGGQRALPGASLVRRLARPRHRREVAVVTG